MVANTEGHEVIPVNQPGWDAAPDDPGIHALEAMVSRVLEAGVALSLTLLLLGSVLLFVRGDSGYGQGMQNAVALTTHVSLASFPHTVSAVFRGVAGLRPYAVIALGLLVLIATPVIRVAVTLIGFLRARDWRYVAITAIVLAVLITSFALGKAG